MSERVACRYFSFFHQCAAGVYMLYMCHIVADVAYDS